jgi:hypothetical protein
VEHLGSLPFDILYENRIFWNFRNSTQNVQVSFNLRRNNRHFT